MAFSSDITSTAAAPSLSGQALPAVTVPSGLKAGLSSPSFSTVVPGLGPSSCVTFVPSERDKKWLKLYDAHKGKIDESFGKLAFTTPPLAAYSSLDAKYTTTDMTKKLQTWALFGPPLGKTLAPTFEQRSNHSEVRPLVSHPWTVLTATEPRKGD